MISIISHKHESKTYFLIYLLNIDVSVFVLKCSVCLLRVPLKGSVSQAFN